MLQAAKGFLWEGFELRACPAQTRYVPFFAKIDSTLDGMFDGTHPSKLDKFQKPWNVPMNPCV